MTKQIFFNASMPRAGSTLIQNILMQNPEIYSTPTCTYCHAAKDFFTQNGVEYTEYDVAADINKRAEMVEKSGQMGVPVIDIEGTIIIGFDEERIKEALA
jgi:glutaredoxin-like YruB-family protein